MLKEDELLMINKILTVGVGKIFETLQPTKRQVYILYKWANKGYVEFGTSIRYVWLTKKGYTHFSREIVKL